MNICIQFAIKGSENHLRILTKVPDSSDTFLMFRISDRQTYWDFQMKENSYISVLLIVDLDALNFTWLQKKVLDLFQVLH
jgi:hypothetical protein